MMIIMIKPSKSPSIIPYGIKNLKKERVMVYRAQVHNIIPYPPYVIVTTIIMIIMEGWINYDYSLCLL